MNLWVNKVGPYHNPHVSALHATCRNAVPPFSPTRGTFGLFGLAPFPSPFRQSIDALALPPTKQQETYEYYDLPFCKPVGGVETRRRGQSLGEQLEGHELINSGLKLRSATDKTSDTYALPAVLGHAHKVDLTYP